MYIYFISSKAFGDNIHKIINSDEKREIVDIIKNHQLLYRSQFDVTELTADIDQNGYNEFLKNIECYKDLKRFYKFDTDIEEFKTLLEAYCTFNSKLSKFSKENDTQDDDKEDDDKEDQIQEESKTKLYVKETKYNTDMLKLYKEINKDVKIESPLDNYNRNIKTMDLIKNFNNKISGNTNVKGVNKTFENKFANIDLRDSRVSYIYDDTADTFLHKQVSINDPKTIFTKANSIRDSDHKAVLKNIKQMSDKEWKLKSKDMNGKVNEDGSTANIFTKIDHDTDEDQNTEEEDQNIQEEEEIFSREIAFVNNLLLEKKIIYFEEDEIHTLDHDDFNEFNLLEKFIIKNNDMVISIITYKLERYLKNKKDLSIEKISKIIKLAEDLIEDSDEDEKQDSLNFLLNSPNISLDLQPLPDLKKYKIPNSPETAIRDFITKHCLRVSGNKELARNVFNKFNDYIYENNFNSVISQLNKTKFTQYLKKHFLYKRFTEGMYWINMKLVD